MAGSKEFQYIDERIDLHSSETESPTPPLRLVVMGKGPFANDTLKGLLEVGHTVVGVFGPAIQEGGTPDPIRTTAKEQNIPNFKFSSLKEERTIEMLQEFRPDLIIGANLTAIIDDEVANIAPLGIIGFHPSLLPEYRGSSAIPWQLIHGKEEIGMSCYVIGKNEQIEPKNADSSEKKALQKGSLENDPNDIADKGPIIAQTLVSLSEGERTSTSAYSKKISKLGVKFLIDTTAYLSKAYSEGKIYRGEKQVKDEGSYQPPLLKRHARIDWNNGATEIDALIRGTQYNPGAWTQIHEGENMYTLYDSTIYEGPTTVIGEIQNIGDEEALISTGAGLLGVRSMRKGEMVSETQELKGPPQTASEFLKQNKIQKGFRFR